MSINLANETFRARVPPRPSPSPGVLTHGILFAGGAISQTTRISDERIF